MATLVWVVEGTWESCVDAASSHTPPGQDIVLLHVTPGEVSAVAHGAYEGLLGRGGAERDPAERLAALSVGAEEALLEAAEQRLGRSARRVRRTGRVEREVVAATQGATLLVVARDGDRRRLGPKSLGPATRFVVDHAPCPVLLVWPEQAPDIGSIPPPPPPPDPDR